MPIVAAVTIALAGILAAALAVALVTVLVQLRRTSATLGDIDRSLAGMPAGLAGLEPTLGRMTGALRLLGHLSERPTPSATGSATSPGAS